MLYLTLSILSSCTLLWMFRYFSDKNLNIQGIITVNYITCLISTLVVNAHTLNIQSLMDEFVDNQIIWESQMSFEPYVGIEVYVYNRNSSEKFVSLISPEQWNNKFDCFGKFKLDTDFSWRRIHN